MRHVGPVNVGDERRRFRVLPPQVLESLPYDLEPHHSRAPQLITQIAVEIQNTCNFLTVEVWAEIHGSQSLAGSPVLELLMKAAPQRERNQGHPLVAAADPMARKPAANVAATPVSGTACSETATASAATVVAQADPAPGPACPSWDLPQPVP